MYFQLLKTRLASPTTAYVLGLLILLGVFGKVMGTTTHAAITVTLFTVVAVLFPTILIGDNTQYRALNLTSKQGFVSELMIVIPLALVAAWLFLDTASPLARGICAAVFVAGLALNHWGITDRNADKKVTGVFARGQDAHSGENSTPVVQLIWKPAAQGTAVMAAFLTAALALGFFLDLSNTSFLTLTFIVGYFSVFLSCVMVPSMIIKTGGPGAWHAFGLPRKQYLSHAMAAALVGSMVAGGAAVLIAAAINFDQVQESWVRYCIAWGVWTVTSVVMVPLAARLPGGAQYIVIASVIFFMSTFINEGARETLAVVVPIALAVSTVLALLGAWSLWSVLTGNNGTRLVVAETVLAKRVD